MFISKLRLENFKRFTDLTIDLSSVQPPPKLVLMIGANGSGKSCVFDLFERVSQYLKDQAAPDDDPEYYSKDQNRRAEARISFWDTDSAISMTNFPSKEALFRLNSGGNYPRISSVHFYGRSSYRYVPKLSYTYSTRGLSDAGSDSDRPRRYIEPDQRFENDVVTLIEKAQKAQEEGFDGESDTESLSEKFITPINDAMGRIFGEDAATSLRLISLLPPADNKPVEIRFRKGNTEINYDLLSSGEKEVFNILLNLFVRREYYQDTIYFIDELDAHLNTSLQYDLLKEITENRIPDNCQLWTASHSLGFIEYARQSTHAVILDFEQIDFDQPYTLLPQSKESLECYKIAVPKETILKIFEGKELVVCENKDDALYNLIGLEGKLFVGLNNKERVYTHVKNDPDFRGLVDRDYLTGGEINRIRDRIPQLLILRFYSIENYLYHPENIQELLAGFDIEAYKAAITKWKNDKQEEIIGNLTNSRKSYSFFKEMSDILKHSGKDKDDIADALRSNDFETFYPFFDLKNGFTWPALDRLKPRRKELAQTNWFRTAISNIFA